MAAAGSRLSGPYGSIRGSYQPFSSWKSITNRWSVNTVPKVRSRSLGFGFFVAARVILIGSLMASLTLENDRLAVEPEHLTINVRDLAEAYVVLHRLDEDRHDVPGLTARVGELPEPPLHLRHVPRRLEAPDPVDLLELDGFADLQVRDRARFRHHVLVDAHDHLLAAVVHQLVPVRRVGDLLLRIARVDRADHAAHRVDLPDVLERRLLHLVGQRLEEVRPAERVDRERDAGFLGDDLLSTKRNRHR